jgi:hypothetical protein
LLSWRPSWPSYRLTPSNFVDRTAEKVGTVIGIIGATAGKDKPK